ncbi:MAG: hypothetical protein O3A84_16665 [Proteobacteria bacterium]|nr:hypothetical protein [Pseudomonadota bacterium]
MKRTIKLLSLVGGAAVGLSLLATPALAEFPDKPVRIIIPFPPGGTTDTVFRTIQPYLSKALGTQVVIVNTKGAGGAVGMVARGRPLMAGDVVMSGALGPMVAVTPGEVYEARISGLGSVRAVFGA